MIEHDPVMQALIDKLPRGSMAIFPLHERLLWLRSMALAMSMSYGTKEIQIIDTSHSVGRRR